jgi:methionine-rich copper-binding protein CopC
MNRLATFAAAVSFGTAPALALPSLVSATPAAGSTIASPSSIALTLSEAVTPRLSGATMVMTGMPGMADHAPMKMPVTTSIAADGKTITLKPSKKLPSGTYRVDWHAASREAQRATGTHGFTVK